MLLALGILFTYLLLCYLFPPFQKPKEESDGSDTEFTAEVVRISMVRAHPNADRLEIANFELARSGAAAYEVVVGKGDFHQGDLARYFSVDCLLPVARPEFAFLKSKEHPGRMHHRLRAARLRGVYSQGLLVPAREGDELGRRVAASCEVSYYRSEEEEFVLPKAGAKKASRHFAPIYDLVSLKKVQNLFKPDDEVVITEKIHGCNFRFGWLRSGWLRRWKFHVGSHRCDLSPGGDSLWARAAALNNLAQATSGAKGTIFYGEVYGTTENGKAIQENYSYGQVGPCVRVFDARENGRWLTAKERLELLHKSGLRGVPMLAIGYSECLSPEEMADGPSALDSGTRREGCVVELYNAPRDRRKGKYVGSDYLLGKTVKKAKAS